MKHGEFAQPGGSAKPNVTDWRRSYKTTGTHGADQQARGTLRMAMMTGWEMKFAIPCLLVSAGCWAR
jgi:hypothetical protein